LFLLIAPVFFPVARYPAEKLGFNKAEVRNWERLEKI